MMNVCTASRSCGRREKIPHSFSDSADARSMQFLRNQTAATDGLCILAEHRLVQGQVPIGKLVQYSSPLALVFCELVEVVPRETMRTQVLMLAAVASGAPLWPLEGEADGLTVVSSLKAPELLRRAHLDSPRRASVFLWFFGCCCGCCGVALIFGCACLRVWHCGARTFPFGLFLPSPLCTPP